MELVLKSSQILTKLFDRTMNDSLCDDRVVKRTLGGDVEAFRLLVKRYERPLYTLCLRMVRNPDDAEDCAQSAFLKAYSALESFKPGRSFKNWIYQIAANVCVDHLRKLKRQPATPTPAELVPENLRDRQPTPRQAASMAEIRQTVRHALDLLDDVYRLPLLLFYMEGVECKEIAAMLQLRLGTVKTRMRRGRILLRETISTQCPELALGEVEPL